MKDWAVIVSIILTFAILDGLWLGGVRKNFYASEFQRIQKAPLKVRMGGAWLAYILMVIAVLYLSIPHVRKDHLFQDSAVYGGLLGLVIYGIYNGTNYATLSHYSATYVWTDTLWGVILMMSATYVGASVKAK